MCENVPSLHMFQDRYRPLSQATQCSCWGFFAAASPQFHKVWIYYKNLDFFFLPGKTHLLVINMQFTFHIMHYERFKHAEKSDRRFSFSSVPLICSGPLKGFSFIIPQLKLVNKTFLALSTCFSFTFGGAGFSYRITSLANYVLICKWSIKRSFHGIQTLARANIFTRTQGNRLNRLQCFIKVFIDQVFLHNQNLFCVLMVFNVLN